MVYAFTQDVPIRKEMYEKIREGLGPDVPDGLISHLVLQNADGTMKYIDIWNSEAAWEVFVAERLHPVIDGIFSRAGFDPGAEPERIPAFVVDLWRPTA